MGFKSGDYIVQPVAVHVVDRHRRSARGDPPPASKGLRMVLPQLIAAAGRRLLPPSIRAQMSRRLSPLMSPTPIPWACQGPFSEMV